MKMSKLNSDVRSAPVPGAAIFNRQDAFVDREPPVVSTLLRPGRPRSGVAVTRFRRDKAFSLLEVMIAVGIFFIATFTILDLISTSLAGARRLQRPMVDASALLSQMSLTNQLVEGSYSGNLSDALGKNYSSYRWVGEITEVGSNKLFMADFAILPAYGGGGVISRSTTLFYRPQSPAGSMDGGNFIHK